MPAPESGQPMTSLPPASRFGTHQDPFAMPTSVHGEDVVSAFRHLPLLGQVDDTYTVITLNADSTDERLRYNVFRARFAPALGRWSIDTSYRVSDDLPWTRAAAEFTRRISDRAS